jgi:hypothetical protein
LQHVTAINSALIHAAPGTRPALLFQLVCRLISRMAASGGVVINCCDGKPSEMTSTCVSSSLLTATISPPTM